MTTVPYTEVHKECHTELCDVLSKYDGKISAKEMIGLMSNIVGGLIAALPVGTSVEYALELVTENLLQGNQEVALVLGDTQGSA